MCKGGQFCCDQNAREAGFAVIRGLINLNKRAESRCAYEFDEFIF